METSNPSRKRDQTARESNSPPAQPPLQRKKTDQPSSSTDTAHQSSDGRAPQQVNTQLDHEALLLAGDTAGGGSQSHEDSAQTASSISANQQPATNEAAPASDENSQWDLSGSAGPLDYLPLLPYKAIFDNPDYPRGYDDPGRSVYHRDHASDSNPKAVDPQKLPPHLQALYLNHLRYRHNMELEFKATGATRSLKEFSTLSLEHFERAYQPRITSSANNRTKNHELPPSLCAPDRMKDQDGNENLFACFGHTDGTEHSRRAAEGRPWEDFMRHVYDGVYKRCGLVVGPKEKWKEQKVDECGVCLRKPSLQNHRSVVHGIN